MEKYIAIDNVCAWPNIKKLPSGEIIAVIFGQPCHMLWEGTIECWVSTNNGKSWEFRSNPVVNKPETSRGNVAVGMNKNREIIVLCGGWDNAAPSPEKYVQGNVSDNRIKDCLHDKKPLWPLCSTSKDHGKTWEVREIKVENLDIAIWVPYGDIITFDNGKLGCAMYGIDCKTDSPLDSATKLGSFFLESADNGMTWKCLSSISDEGNETALTKLPNGKILAAVRKTFLDLYESDDGGKSWQHVSFLTAKGQYPGSFTILNDGHLLATYGIRNNGFYGIGAMIMELGTEKWHTPYVLTDFGNVWDGGYPSSVQLDNGDIVTAYYCSPASYHNRYHMGVMIWNMEEQKLLNSCP